MRQEEKEVDGYELEHAEERKRENDLIEEDEEELFDLDGKPEFDRDQERTTLVAGAMHKILEREHIVIGELVLDQRELLALEALKTAVEGRDQEIHGFVFAEDRRALLEQALAVLQPELANLEQLGGKPFEDLVKEVADLRGQLSRLEDAQEEIEPHKLHAEKGEAADTDEPKPDDDQSLTGPERKLDKPASSLAGPERKEEPKPPTSLTGPEVKDAPKPPTTLGDPKEIADAAQPWWKK
ncbi:MAG TPA: hypothetical protein VIV11_42670 [Kofleriaceae bacterium]